MEPTERGKDALISGIEADAHAEEQRLLKEAHDQAAEKTKYAGKKAADLVEEARDKATAQAEAIKHKAVAEVDRQIKRRMLKMRDTLMRDIVARAEEKLGSLIDGPDYRAVLANWITEAAVGLSVDKAEVNASARELPLIDAALLSEVAKRVTAETGKPMTLTISDAEPLEGQGVVLTSVDGRMAFNNQVGTRIGRKQREIQALIYDAAFAGHREE
jgi:vacuolar-type H+-ATPase subunit E/Vma4